MLARGRIKHWVWRCRLTLNRHVKTIEEESYNPSSGKRRSNLPAMLRDFSDATSRKRSKTVPCPSWSPCEKLKRATFMPASIRIPILSLLQQAGPIVQTIFVRRFEVCVGAMTRAKSIWPPWRVGMALESEIMMTRCVWWMIYSTKNVVVRRVNCSCCALFCDQNAKKKRHSTRGANKPVVVCAGLGRSLRWEAPFFSHAQCFTPPVDLMFSNWSSRRAAVVCVLHIFKS